MRSIKPSAGLPRTAGCGCETISNQLPPVVRQRLQASPFNLCPACLVTEFLPLVQVRYPEHSRETALMAAIIVMELQLKKDKR
jgi:hypothetical protein